MTGDRLEALRERHKEARATSEVRVITAVTAGGCLTYHEVAYRLHCTPMYAWMLVKRLSERGDLEKVEVTRRGRRVAGYRLPQGRGEPPQGQEPR